MFATSERVVIPLKGSLMRLVPQGGVGQPVVAIILVTVLALELWAPIALAQQTPTATVPTAPGAAPSPSQPATIPLPSRPTVQPQFTRRQAPRTVASPSEVSSFPCPPGFMPVPSERPGEVSFPAPDPASLPVLGTQAETGTPRRVELPGTTTGATTGTPGGARERFAAPGFPGIDCVPAPRAQGNASCR